MKYVIIIVSVTCIIIALLPVVGKWVDQLHDHIKRRLAKHLSKDVFYSNYIDTRVLYLQEFGETPSMNYISNIDNPKAIEYISGNAGRKILAIYQRNYYSWKQQKQETTVTIFKLENSVLIEVSKDGVEILHTNADCSYAAKMIEALIPFKAAEKEEDFEINVITQTSDGLALKQLEIKSTALDIDLYYNDDFKEVDKVIKERLTKENDKGIILLHGLPGTGKTTYLRHLIGNIHKRVLFVSPGVAGNLMNPEFLDLLIDHPNAVLVIEDAENIIMDRRQSSSSNSVSNLLNISDGLLSDCLNVQIICTFNSALHLVDEALMRKGRLIAKYEFGKLETAKARRLSEHLGLTQIIDQPMTLANIANSHEVDYHPVKVNIIGFRRTEELLEN